MLCYTGFFLVLSVRQSNDCRRDMSKIHVPSHSVVSWHERHCKKYPQLISKTEHDEFMVEPNYENKLEGKINRVSDAKPNTSDVMFSVFSTNLKKA